MLKLLMVAILTFTSISQAAENQAECETLIKKKFPGAYSIMLKSEGNGKYATHYYYDIKYITDLKNPYTKLGCIARVHCADYDNLVYIDLKHCGR